MSKTLLRIMGVLFLLQSEFGFAQELNLIASNNGRSIKQIIREVEQKTEYTFFFHEDANGLDKRVNLSTDVSDIDAFMNQLLQGTSLTYKLMEDGLIIISPKKMMEKTIKGKVTDANTSMPIPGALVTIKGGTEGTVTDMDGNFSIVAKQESVTLIFSFIGYQSTEVAVSSGQTLVNISLSEDVNELEQVVVTALGVKREEKALGYAVQKISGETLQKVKGVDIGTTLTGKVAGLTVKNSTEFFEKPTITLRGASPLLVIDGVPYGNMTLRDISMDDVESMDILKGPTASALYGARGGNGAIIITTKRGADKKGVTVSVNSNNMVFSGFLMLPEVQSSYSAGYNGQYNTDDYVWGDKLDIGRTAMQWDPIAKEMRETELTSKGKNNFRNFLQPSFITNNNINITQQGEFGSVRASLTHVLNKGQYPNTKLNMINYSIGGEMKLGEKFHLDGTMGYNKRKAPQIAGTGYGAQGYIYNLLVWTGPEYDVTQFKDYWIKKDEVQNWHYTAWYDNPYMMAYEKLHSIDQNTFNTAMTANYKLAEGVKVLFRSGLDYYINQDIRRNPPGIFSTRGWDAKGMYSVDQRKGFSINSDLMLMGEKKIGDFGFEGILGGTIYYYEDEGLSSSTRSGLSIPGFYSLNSSVETPNVSNWISRKQVNSMFAKAGLSYKTSVFLDLTGRNDWSSTLPQSTRSYFYPSVGSSVVLSEMISSLPKWVDFLKLRGSWALSKRDLGVYATNSVFSVSNNVWDGMNTGRYPENIRGAEVAPQTERTYEFGLATHVLNNKLKLDVAYFNKYIYNIQANATISASSGFSSRLINTEETFEWKGLEVTAEVTPIKNEKLQWNVIANWSKSHRYYKQLDPVYSPDNPWVKEGGRTDLYLYRDWERDPSGNLINYNGFPQRSRYNSLMGTFDPNWIWGLTNVLNLGQFTFSLSFDGRVGGLSYSSTNARLFQTGAHPDLDNQYRYEEVVNDNLTFMGPGVKVVSGDVTYDNYGNIVEDSRVFEVNDQIVSFESYYKGYGTGSQNIFDETFLKLREVSIAYQLPTFLASKIKARSASVALTGQNLFIWTKEYRFSDPDKASDDLNSPSIRYTGLNLKLTF
ncbi:SusC/RagA family TonB-linked outer membrane protein [Echinicola shivajiensis]|uniref:SusC/RagA family TonB-linked outer membrane protein n=1 Tax=Echinicola shivajiensis TaxID=1035916 RepID=UPI001BFC2491|nr:SusC/RagA family TonB-linked outer membrane protein [Echinicola shivajiensis]